MFIVNDYNGIGRISRVLFINIFSFKSDYPDCFRPQLVHINKVLLHRLEILLSVLCDNGTLWYNGQHAVTQWYYFHHQQYYHPETI